MRLVGGESEFEGRVEVCLNRRWGTVGSDGWTQTNTRVVCNELGYDFSGKPIRIKISQTIGVHAVTYMYTVHTVNVVRASNFVCALPLEQCAAVN